MKKLLLTLLTALMLNAAWAGPEQDALAAYFRKDFATALKIIRPLAIKGDASGQIWLADAYRDGEGVVQDYAEAVRWYRLVAQQGNILATLAQYNLGKIYYNDQSVLQDYAEGLKWYRLAARRGWEPAQSNLGTAYAEGKGVAQDYVKAHSWFNLGARKENADAVQNRDDVAKLMTSQQIAEAQKLARKCQARNFKGCD